MSVPRLGALFPALADPARLPAFATEVEAVGLDALWVIEDCFLSAGLTMAATALAVTKRLRVGVGLLPASVRNPVFAAMEISTLGRMHPGRFEVAFGHGVPEWMEQIGAAPPNRLAALRETTTAVRRLLSGETVSVAGDWVNLRAVELERAPEQPPPVLIGTTGPKGLALAGECSDGVLLPEGSGPRFVEWAVEKAAFRRTARCVVYAWMNLDTDGDRARARLAPALDQWLDRDLFPAPRRIAGVATPPPVGSPARTALAHELAVCGDAGACAASVREFARAGADTVVLAPQGDDVEEQLKRFGREVLPLLRER